jgi:pyruvate formate lyase activating enzyme
MGKDIIIRIPIIPGFNDSKEELEDMKNYISTLKNIKEVDLLSYHSIGQEKYNRIGKPYKMKDVKEPSEEEMNYAVSVMEGSGIKVKIGG